MESAIIDVPCAPLASACMALPARAAALQDLCAERIADYAVPETWTIGTEALPRVTNGKLMKQVLPRHLVLTPNWSAA